LQANGHFNDDIVNFFIQEHLKKELLSCQNEDFHFDSSYLWTQLREQPKRVLEWRVRMAAKTDIFKKKYLVMPIHHRGRKGTGHWGFVVVVNAGKVGGKTIKQVQQLKAEDAPAIMYICSLNWNFETGLKTILHHLQDFWKKLHSRTSSFLTTPFRILHPKAPKQDNSDDCGVYLCLLMERFCRSPPSEISEAAIEKTV
jgi:Ulp1 family protease